MQLISIYCVYGQEDERTLQDLVESVTDQISENTDLLMVIDQIQFVQKNPINLNKASASTLNVLYFLNALQVQQIVEYIQKYGPLGDIAELQTLNSMNPETLRLLEKVVTLEDKNNLNLKQAFKKIESRLIARYANNFNQNLRGFEGDPGRMYIRYQLNTSDLMQVNFTLDKDAGEYYWSRKYPYRVDFFLGNITLAPQKRIQKVIIGDYHLQFGQGLILWTGFALGISPDITSAARKPMGLKSYNAATEFNFMRGLASSLTFFKNKLHLTPFISLQKLDAGFNTDNEITGLQQTGYHRTLNEIKNKASLPMKNLGVTATWQYKQFHLGAIYQWIKFKYPFESPGQLYEKFSPRFQIQRNLGLNYQLVVRNMYLYGETAFQNQSQWATVNGALISMSKNASFSVSYRKYSVNYQSFNSQAVSVNTRSQNETGLYMGIDFKPFKKWQVQTFADWFSFPWLKYQVDVPSQGYQMLVQTIFQWKKEHRFLIRYRHRNKAVNQVLQKGQNFRSVIDVNSDNIRMQCHWKGVQNWHFESRIDALKVQSSKVEYGVLIYQDIDYAFSRALRIGFRCAFFKTDGYDSRIYAFENNVLYAFGFGVFQGKGLKNYLNIHYKISGKLGAWCRMASTRNLTPTNSWKNELTVQIAYYF